MRYRNDGKSEANVLQNQFTRYLTVAIRRKRAAILSGRSRIGRHEEPTHGWYVLTEISLEEDYAKQISSPPDFENAALNRVLTRMKERDRYIFFARILDERDFHDLAAELGMSYKGVAAAYYRTIRKIKKEMWREDP